MTCLATGLFMCGMIGVGNATNLNPNVYTPLNGTTVAANPNLAGIVEKDDLVPFYFSAYGGTVSGQVQVRVVKSIDSTYDFYWRVFNDANSAGKIADLRIANFFTSSYNADYRTDGLGDIGPDQAYLFGAFDGYVNFNFSDGLVAGESSKFFFLDTDATSFNKSLLFDLTNMGQTEISMQYGGYAPSASVPEPATMLLFGTGIAGLAATGIRRRTKK